MKRTVMNGILSGFLAFAVSATLVVVLTTTPQLRRGVPIVHAQSGCSEATLTGNYSVSWQGFDIPKGAAHEVPWAGVGVLGFDGAGNVSVSFTQALDGKITTGATGTGTYTVNRDCTGSASFTSGDAAGESANFVIVSGGTEVLFVSTLSSQTILLDAKKQ